ncbi:MAG: chromosomal replication initiator protein DnaA [Phycisphaerales bacterium]|nr:chromosomal replication initiator protein DnaA [Phycisphaerales bacterium]
MANPTHMPVSKDQMYAELQKRIGPQRYNAWFRHGTRLELEGERLEVAVPNSFVANWIEQHYQGALTDVASELSGAPVNVVISIEPDLIGECSRRNLDQQAEMVNRVTQGRIRPRQVVRRAELRHSLDDFVIGTSNRLAFQAAMATAEGKHPQFRQLFLHGSCGVGKTHLLQGICNEIQRRSRGHGEELRWRYVSGEQFTNEFVASVRNRNGAAEFRKKYRKLDLLAIDDVHFLAAKPATQAEFLHTFNAIESAGKRIILASDTHPQLVGDLNEQLSSRFMSGMVVQVESPDRQTRMDILKRKSDALGLGLPEDVQDYIAMHIRSSVRELEGTLVKLSALAGLENKPVTLEMTRDALADHLARTGGVISLGDIETVAATYFGVTPADLHSSRRTKTVSSARMVTMFLARKYTTMSYPEIARHMGKNHSSVVLGVQRFEKLLASGAPLCWTSPAGAKSVQPAELIDMLDGQLR